MLPFCTQLFTFALSLLPQERGHGGTVVTHSPPTAEVSNANPRPYVGKLMVAY